MVKYKIEIYHSRYEYTPYDKDPEIPESQFNSDIPKSVNLNNQTIKLFDEDMCFIPQINVYSEFTKPGDIVWKHCKKTDWYTHKSGLKVKLEEIKSGLKNANENGWIKTTLTVKIPLPSERGKNPNSHHNHIKMPHNITKDIKLTPEQWETIKTLGNGQGYSQGVRNLLDKLSQLEAV